MKKLAEKEEIRNLLSKYYFEMFNRENDYKGEMTTLNEQDIDDILYDMRKGVVVEMDENDRVIVTYPHNVCKLESRELI